MSELLIRLEGLEVYAYHGVPQAEREIGHRYLVDITLLVESTADVSDEVQDTLNYAELAELATQLFKQGSVKTLEHLGKLLEDAILARWPSVLGGEIEVAKPLPPMPHIVQQVSVSRTFGRLA